MVNVRQFGGLNYNTDDYPYVVIEKKRNKVSRFSNLEKAHKGRFMTALNNQDDIILLFNQKTQKFIDWRKKDKVLFEKYKHKPDEYFDKVVKWSR